MKLLYPNYTKEVINILTSLGYEETDFKYIDEDGNENRIDEINIGDRIIAPRLFTNIWFKRTGTYHEGNDEKFFAIEASIIIDDKTGYVFEKKIDFKECSLIDKEDYKALLEFSNEALEHFDKLDKFNNDHNLSIFDGTTKITC